MRFIGRLCVLIGCLTGLVAGARSAVPELSAQVAVESYINTLFVTIDEIRPLYMEDRQSYFLNVESALAHFVDFNEVARGVMAKYSAGPNGASSEQLNRFANVFKASLVEFYGSALADYKGSSFEFLPSRGVPKNPEKSTNVRMKLLDGEGGLEVQYTMFLNEERVWKLKNLYVEGINLRRQYHSRFDGLMVKSGHDIDAVIERWQLVE